MPQESVTMSENWHSPFNMLNRAFASVRFVVPVNVRLEHRQSVAAMCIFFKILNSPDHPMHSRLPGPRVPMRRTRREVQMNSCALVSALSRNSVHYNRSFLPSVIELWNFLPQEIVDSRTMESFKSKVNLHLLRQLP